MTITTESIQYNHREHWDRSKPYVPLTPKRIQGIKNLCEYFREHPDEAPNFPIPAKGRNVKHT